VGLLLEVVCLIDSNGHPVGGPEGGVSRFIAMRQRQKLKTQRQRKHKEHVARTPAAVAKYKALFLKQLALGCSPGAAARNLNIARSTAYGWKKEDEEFDAAWVDAVETGLDVLETCVYDSALAGNSSAAQFLLKHRRREVYGNAKVRPQQSNFILNTTLQEQFKRLERLGLPIPQIESDYEEDDRKPEDVAKYKERFLKQLALGRSPGVAARNVKIARSTAYGWKKEDQEFDAAWVDAVETALDRLETQLYDSAMNGNSSDAQFILTHRRYNIRDGRPQQSNFISQITLQEHYKRLERLGLPISEIESDYEELDAPTSE
jgi:hypothetical protein